MKIKGTTEEKWLAEELDAYMEFLIARHKTYDPWPREIASILRQMADYMEDLENY